MSKQTNKSKQTRTKQELKGKEQKHVGANTIINDDGTNEKTNKQLNESKEVRTKARTKGRTNRTINKDNTE